MHKGFIFDHNRCVGCGACSIACILENGWDVHPRKVYCYNSDVSSSLPLINLSLACNHCEKPVCLEGCPSGSYFRDPVTDAVIIDDNKCIGCRYCQWNCPYDAPKFNNEKRVIGKCNLCYTGLAEGRLPACVYGCPTGALSYGDLNEIIYSEFYPWFPGKDLKPAIEFPGKKSYLPLKVIPVRSDEINEFDSKAIPKEKKVSSDWSLVAFTFLTTLSVSGFASSLINGDFQSQVFSVVLLFIAGLLSIIHLGRKLRAWRALFNMRSSPLSREIGMFILFFATAAATLVLDSPALFVTASIIGIILLFAVDSVYIYADNSKKIILHGGQTFVSSLLIIAFLTGYFVPFIFIASIKMAYSIYSISVNSKTGLNFVLRFFRIFLLLISAAYLISGQSAMDLVIVCLFLTGELSDRILFYIEFEPMNINNLIYNHLIIAGNEKKRG
jgi:Fe-S-cluster-containing dehydrogenase component/DMSO reductase anchor subunit